jgi:hypothetical protein
LNTNIKILKKIVKISGAFLMLVFLYWLTISFPQMFFRWAEFENLHIYYHGEKDVSAVGTQALAKIKRSSLYNPNDVYRVFLTDSAVEYGYFTSFWRSSGGVFLVVANCNTFIRPSLVAEDRLISPAGKIVAEDRPLNYYVAHEATHAMEFNRLGWSKYLALNVWIREGVADYVGRDEFDFAAMLEKYRAGASQMNPAESGLYLKYQLLVEFALKDENSTVDALLESNADEARTEADLRQKIAVQNTDKPAEEHQNLEEE